MISHFSFLNQLFSQLDDRFSWLNHVKSLLSQVFHYFPIIFPWLSHYYETSWYNQSCQIPISPYFPCVFPLLSHCYWLFSHLKPIGFTRPAMAWPAMWPSTARSWVPWPGRMGSKGGPAEKCWMSLVNFTMKNPWKTYDDSPVDGMG